MYTHFNPIPGIAKIGILVISLFFAGNSNAQVNVTSTVMPPYSTRLTDYTQKPGKLSVTLYTLGEIGNPTVYIEGKLTSIDGDVEIYTHPGAKPKSGGIQLTNKAMRTLTFNEIATIFDDHVLVYKGISREQVLRNGLPEGTYRFCFKVYDYTANRLLSSEETGCSNMFNISAVEPPMILNPQNNSEIPAIGSQNILFQWTMPAGAPIGIKYTLKIIELDNPNRNPDEAMNSTGYPVFFETEVNSTIYPYTVANPPLTKGKKYAFRVTATEITSTTRDVQATTYFRNGGKSEVFTFTYGSQENPGETITPGAELIYILNPPYNHKDSILYTGKNADFYLRWTLNDPSVGTISQNKDTLVPPTARYRVDIFHYDGSESTPIHTYISPSGTHPYYQVSEEEAGKFLADNKSYKFNIKLYDTISNQILAESPLWAFKYKKGLVSAQTDTCIITGILKYKFEGEQDVYPIPNTTIRITAGYFLKTANGEEIEVPDNLVAENASTSADKETSASIDKNTKKESGATFPTIQGSKNQQYNKFKLKTNIGLLASMPENLYTIQTDANGKFTYRFTYTKGTSFGAVDSSFSCNLNGKQQDGILSYSIKVYISNPYYYQPENDISFTGLDTLHAGTIVTHVKGYTLKAFVTRGYSKTTQISQQLAGKTIYLFRKQTIAGLPVNEGTKGMAHAGLGEMFGYYLLIGEEKAAADVDKDGNNTASVTFRRLVTNLTPGDEYYMLIEGSPVNTAQMIWFNMDGKKRGSILDSVSILPLMPDFNINKLAGSFGKGFQSIENSVYMSPAVTNTDIYDKMNPANNTLNTLANNTQHQGGQQVMSLQGVNYGNTSADIGYRSMAGTNFMVQSYTAPSSGNHHQSLISGISQQNHAGIAATLAALAQYPIIHKDGTYNFNVETAYRIITDEYPKSKIKGKLVYTWAGKPGFARNLANKTISLVECLVTDDVPGNTKALMNIIPNVINYHYILNTIKTVNTKSDGSFEIEFNNTSFNYGKLYTPTGADEMGPYLIQDKTTVGKSLDNSKVVLGISAKPYTRPIKKVLRILVEKNSNNYAGVFLSPENDIVVDPLDSVNVGTLSSKIVSVGSKGAIVGQSYQNTNNEFVSGAECYLLRRENNLVYPEGEGNSENINGKLPEYPKRAIVDKTESDGQGSYLYHNYMPFGVGGSEPGNDFYFKTKDMMGASNYKPVCWSSLMGIQAWHYPKFNNEFDYVEGEMNNLVMAQANPVVKGQVVSDVNMTQGIDGATCTLSLYMDGYSFYTLTAYSHDGGYFELPIDSLLVELINISTWGWSGIDSTVLTVSKTHFGYRDAQGHWQGSWRRQYGKDAFRPGRQIVEPLVTLAASGTLKGHVRCNSCTPSKPIAAYLQFIEIKSNNKEGLKSSIALYNNGDFTNPGIPAIPGNHKLAVIPYDPAYFSDTIPVHVNEGASTNIQVDVFERLHRVKFKVLAKGNSDTGLTFTAPLAGAIVELCDGQGTAVSATNGDVDLKFKNVSVNNLTMKISGPQGSNYIPKYVTFRNAETAYTVYLNNVTLEKGIALTGKITLNGQPTTKARVYTDISYNAGLDSYSSEGYSYTTKSIFEADINSDGTFTFNALPPEIKGQSITIYAVYKPTATISNIPVNTSSVQGAANTVSANDGSSGSQPVGSSGGLFASSVQLTGNIQGNSSTETVVGDIQTIPVPLPANQQLVLDLKTLNNIRIDNLWGFPLQPYIVQSTKSDHYKVWGAVKLKGFSPGFDIINEENMQFRVCAVEFEPKSTENGVSVYGPVNNTAEINDIRSFKLKYGKTFNTAFSEKNNNNLKIEKRNGTTSDYGVVNGYVHIVDNSFKYPSSYLSFDESDLDQFYFYIPVNANTYKSTIDVFASNTPGNGNQTVKYHLKRKNRLNLNFTFIGFETTAQSINSYIEGNKITLDATLLAKMKNAAPQTEDAQNAGSTNISIHLPKLVLKDNAIDPLSGTEPLMVTLLDGGNIQAGEPWKLEAKNWHISPSEGGLISTQITLHTGKLDVPFSFFNLRSDFAYLNEPDKSNINLGGYPINFGQSKACFSFNPSCGSDRGAHWQLIIYPETVGKPVGTIENLSPDLTGKLEIETVSLLSNNEDVFTISPNVNPMRLYDMTSFEPTMLYTIANGFELVGNISLQIPRVGSSLSATLQFSSAGMHVKPVDITFTGKGNVLFKPKMDETQNWVQKWETHKFTAYGTIEEPGKLDPIDVVLTHNAVTPATLLKESDRNPEQVIKIGESNTTLTSIKTAMSADANDWNNLTFEGNLTGFDGLEGTNRMAFTVFGEIKATGQTLKTAGLTESNPNSPSPFDGMELTYDNGRILGSLNLNNIPIGSFIASGSMNILMDKNGWLFYGNATADNVPLPDPCTANLGMLIGYYKTYIPEDVKTTTLKYAIRKEWPTSFKSNQLMGFFTLAGRDLPISGLDVNIELIVASAYVEVPTAGIDGYVYMNALGNPKFGIGIDGKIQVNFGLNAITCTSLYGSAVACVSGELTNNSFNACAGLKFKLGVKQEIPLVFDCGGTIFDEYIDKEASFSFSAHPFKAHFSLDLGNCSLCNQ